MGLLRPVPQIGLGPELRRDRSDPGLRVAPARGRLLPSRRGLVVATQGVVATAGCQILAVDGAALNPELAGVDLGLVLRVSSGNEMQELAKGFEGQLTATLQMDDGDTEAAKALMPILERKAGRVLVNGFPTGVEVCDAMVHGGPYPASTNFGATSVGTMAIRRFLRPVSYQNLPEALLPEDLRGAST